MAVSMPRLDGATAEAAFEEQHVHTVYEEIATHFSATRYKPWPIVDEFLRSRPTGAVGVDLGCGNGKYLGVNDTVFIVASDRSKALVGIVNSGQYQPHVAIVADILNPPHPDSTFDFAISIAVIHHLASTTRRVQAIQTIVQKLKTASSHTSAGQALIFVWALEQKNSRRGWDRGDDQDVLVPWVLKQEHMHGAASDDKPVTYQRYYHLYRQGELEEDARAAGARIVRSGYDRDNWWVIVEREQCS